MYVTYLLVMYNVKTPLVQCEQKKTRYVKYLYTMLSIITFETKAIVHDENKSTREKSIFFREMKNIFIGYVIYGNISTICTYNRRRKGKPSLK